MLDHEILGEGRTIVFVHGLALDRALLQAAMEPLFAGRPGWRRIHLDLPGHGRTPAGTTPPSADGLLRALQEGLAEVAGPRPLVVGHAYGAYLALGLHAAGADLGGLLLVCPVVEPDLSVRRVPPQRYSARTEGLVFASDEERQTFDGEVAVQTAATLDAFREVVAPAHAATDREFLAGVRDHYVLSLLVRAAARRVACPTAIVCGRDDPWVGFLDAAELTAAIPRASLAVVPDCGQLLPLEIGAQLRTLAAQWLDRVESEERGGGAGSVQRAPA